MMEKKAMTLGAGLLGLSGFLSYINRLNTSSKSLLGALDSMKSMKGWDKIEANQSVGKDFIKFLKGGTDEDHRKMIRSYVNYADDIIGDPTGNLLYNLRWGPETMRWARTQGRWWLPKEMRGRMPVDSTNPAWHALSPPGRITHFRELGGSGKTRSLRHWLIESKTGSMKNFSGLADHHKNVVNRLDDEILKLEKRGLKDEEVFETILNQDWFKPHLSKMVTNKAGVLNPFHPSSFLNQQLGIRESLGKYPNPDLWANSGTVRTALGGGALSTGIGGANLYQEATKPWHEKWQDKLNDWIS